MTALVLAILCSASLALIFRTTEQRGHSRYVITTVNYIAAVATAVVLLLLRPGGTAEVSGPAPGSSNITPLLPPPEFLPVILAIAIPGGVLFFLSFILYQRAVADHGPGPAGMYGKLGILVPMVLSMVVWSEYPGTFQWIGLALAVTAIVLSQWRPVSSPTTPVVSPPVPPATGVTTGPTAFVLLILLLSMGFAEFSTKLFERYGDDRYRALFLAILFTSAFLSSAWSVWRRREHPTVAEIGWGLVVGVPNLFSSFFLIAALRTVPAAVAFPLFSAGSIGVIVIGARLLYGDTLRPNQWIAVALTVAALILINLA